VAFTEHPEVDKVVLVPFTKVTAGILMFSDVEVVGVCDYRDDKVGRSTSKLVEGDVPDLEIHHVDDLPEVLEDAEWLVWTKEVFDRDVHYEIWSRVIDTAILEGVNVYNMGRLHMFREDESKRLEAAKRGLRYFDASDPELHLKLMPYGVKAREEGVNADVVAVIGAARRTGKFTTLNTIREILEEEGVKVGTVGTEPSSMLVGLDAMVIPQVIPLAHAAPTILGAVKYVDEKKEPDVILVGSQTGITADPLEVGTGRGGCICSITILTGCAPDLLVAATRPDTLDELREAIEVAQTLTGARVQFVSVNGKGYDEEDVRKICERIEDELGYPAADPVKMREEFEELVIDLLKPESET